MSTETITRVAGTAVREVARSGQQRLARSTTPGETFGSMLSRALAGLNELQVEADVAATKLASGEMVDLHNAVIAMEKASIGFQLALQVRNKLVEAYQDIMRMQV